MYPAESSSRTMLTKLLSLMLPAEETLPKNIATSIKNVEFLNFFFQRLRRVGPRQREVLKGLNAEKDYPFVSPCGPELNFVRPADLPIVFHGIHETDGKEKELIFGGSLVQPFLPDKLSISPTTGRLYHELIGNNDKGDNSCNGGDGNKAERLTPLHASEKVEYGLIRSSVAVSLSDSIVAGSHQEETDTFSGMDFCCPVSDRCFPIKWLLADAQAGNWAMPFIEGAE